jgi:hypothetical protein
MATSFMLGGTDDQPRPLSPDRHRHRTDTGLEVLDFLRMDCRQTSAEEQVMAKGMIKRGSGSAYTKLIRRRRAKHIRAEDSAPVEPIIIKSHLRRMERKR